jgi:serine/threonine protein kinase
VFQKTYTYVKEIKVLRGVEFEHIIRLENIEEDPLNIYIFTEYYEQGDLFAYIQKHGVFDEAIAKFLFRQMVEAVDYCHTKLHICHHDIKLENLVVNHNLNLKLIDFGFAIPLEQSAGKKMIKIYDGSPGNSHHRNHI